jgi:hypothetical protein
MTQSAVALSQQILQAAERGNEVAESVESTIMRFKTARQGHEAAAIELF